MRISLAFPADDLVVVTRLMPSFVSVSDLMPRRFSLDAEKLYISFTCNYTEALHKYKFKTRIK